MSKREWSAGTPDFRQARHPSKVYRGLCEDGVFTVTMMDSALPQGDDNPRRLTPAISRSLRDCCEEFCWGCERAGSMQLAIALLLDVTGEQDTALQWHQLFTEKYVMKLPQSWTVPEIDIALWLYCFQNARPGS